jgi:hypothetical protein
VLLVGIDWAERHHDVCVMAADGRVLARERIADGVAGVARLHELVAVHASEPAEVVVGIETDRGLLVGALVAAGHQVVAVNPLAASRYRERHTISRTKSDRGDARMLADLVRTDRHHHRRVAGDSGLAEAVKVLARGHQQLVWARQPWRPSVGIPAAVTPWPCWPWRRLLSAVGRCPMPSWSTRCGGLVADARWTPGPPPSRPPWPVSSWKLRRWWLLLTARWWRLRWRSLPA